ncbi:hypothetical protein [Pseudomonas iridis]|uniref:hypothetical protein n=1 Tax=Pseudomonas iridis TaxID=2710587 RepID=UPI001B331C8E|nr:hypothetical protein [Pseudomonas iridis]MBP5971046.1 hypothetical protein [Pseudomonas iridis]
MARRARNGLDEALELWARWCFAGGDSGSAGRSPLAKLIDNKGELMFVGSTGSGVPPDSLEGRIEAAVLSLFARQPLAADVLRLEYDAGWWQVAQRRQIRAYDPRGIGQFERSVALGITLRTYRRRLFEARAFIETQVGTV